MNTARTYYRYSVKLRDQQHCTVVYLHSSDAETARKEIENQYPDAESITLIPVPNE